MKIQIMAKLTKEECHRIKDLQGLTGGYDFIYIDELLSVVMNALANGNTEKAEQLFTQVEEQTYPYITAAAEMAYQRGKLAEDAIDYTGAHMHYHRATQLNPNDSTYLNSAGDISSILDNYAEAIGYYERALSSIKSRLGDEHPDTLLIANNLKNAKAKAALE